ncbi:TPA: hypothetical protein ACE8UO_001659, partial [Neisseria gonorrhoeae]
MFRETASDGIKPDAIRSGFCRTIRAAPDGYGCWGTMMFQHTGRHIKHRPMRCPDLEGLHP